MPGILMRGLSHRRAGLACQDAGAIVVKNGVRIMALSDGCSASKYATQAAYANIKAILTLFCAVRLDVFLALPELMQRIAVIGYAAREIALTAGKIGDHHRRDYAATLIFSVQDATELVIPAASAREHLFHGVSGRGGAPAPDDAGRC